MNKTIISLSIAAALAGCGGGGSESGSTPIASQLQETQCQTQKPCSEAPPSPPSPVDSGSGASGGSTGSTSGTTGTTGTPPASTAPASTAPTAESDGSGTSTTPAAPDSNVPPAASERSAAYYLRWFEAPRSAVTLPVVSSVPTARAATIQWSRMSSVEATVVRATTADGLEMAFSIQTAGEYLVWFNGWQGAELLPGFTSSPEGFIEMPRQNLPGVDRVSAGFMDGMFCFENVVFMLCRDDARDGWRFSYRPRGGQGETYAYH